MNVPPSAPSLQQIGRELAHAREALATPGAGAHGSLSCRVADLEQRLLTTPSVSLDDLATRLEVACAIVAGLGPRGYLLDLLEASLDDARRLAAEGAPRSPQLPDAG